jgi:two-component system sensor histidine kinase DegS
MRERVELLNGKFEIDSAVSKGTRLYITVPLVPEEEV